MALSSAGRAVTTASPISPAQSHPPVIAVGYPGYDLLIAADVGRYFSVYAGELASCGHVTWRSDSDWTRFRAGAVIDRWDADSAVRLADTITWPVSMTSVSVDSRLRGTLADGLKLTPFT